MLSVGGIIRAIGLAGKLYYRGQQRRTDADVANVPISQRHLVIPLWELGSIRELLTSTPRYGDAKSKLNGRIYRTIALCWADGRDIGADMVRAGMAWAFRPLQPRLRRARARGTSGNLGVHSHQCEPAWEWSVSAGNLVCAGDMSPKMTQSGHQELVPSTVRK